MHNRTAVEAACVSGSGLTIETARVAAHNALAQPHAKGLRLAEAGFIREDIVMIH